ncbi:MAG: (5-formylfuran-3-yl)methyl phosphate synthase [Hyphomicrobium sp.]
MLNAQLRGAPAFLASVRSADEAQLALACGADVIDCKDPVLGALGRLDISEIAAVVRDVAGRAPVSATIGDTFADAAGAVRAAEEVAEAGVAIVKCGFFGGPGDASTIAALASARLGGAHLFAVLMADRIADFSLVPALAKAGFIGVMLDTAGKDTGALPEIMEAEQLTGFIAAARAHQLAAGLAGSLREGDIAPLAALGPELLGFRGALCIGGRTGTMDIDCVLRVRQEIDRSGKVQRKRSVA